LAAGDALHAALAVVGVDLGDILCLIDGLETKIVTKAEPAALRNLAAADGVYIRDGLKPDGGDSSLPILLIERRYCFVPTESDLRVLRNKAWKLLNYPT
jgi:hypothetical protein